MSFPAEVAEKLIAAAAEAGVAAGAVYAAAGIAPGEPLDYAALASLYEAAARLAGDEAFGLRVGLGTRPQMYGLLGYAAAHAATLGEALSRLAALGGAWTDAVAFELRSERGAAVLRYRDQEGVPAGARRQECEQMMAALLTFARSAAGEDLRPVEVRFEHDAPADCRAHRDIFSCTLLFGAPATELLFGEAALARRLPAADPTLGELIRGQAEAAIGRRSVGPPLLRALRALVLDGVRAGRAPSLETAAAALGLGPRTLQRRLGEHGTSWRAVLDRERIGEAKALLADPRLGLARIAFRCGFSEASAFHRAFRRIAGTTPRRYRLALEAGRQRR